jgi:hypothetical protein
MKHKTLHSNSKRLTTIVSLLLLCLAACNKNNDSSSSNGPANADCSGYRYYNPSVPGGYSSAVYDPSRNTCIDPLTGQGYGAPISNYLSFFSQNWDRSNYSTFNSIQSINAYNPVRNMTITNGGVYQTFLRKAMGVCDRQQSTGGTASCTAWISGGLDLVLQASTTSNTTAQITVRAWPQQSYGASYNYSFPNAGQLLASFFGFPVFSNVGAYLNPLALSLTMSPINNSAGFEGRAYGDAYSTANRSLIQLQVATGKLTNTSFQYTFNFEGSEFARGTFQRCQTVDCGTSSFFGN